MLQKNGRTEQHNKNQYTLYTRLCGIYVNQIYLLHRLRCSFVRVWTCDADGMDQFVPHMKLPTWINIYAMLSVENKCCFRIQWQRWFMYKSKRLMLSDAAICCAVLFQSENQTRAICLNRIRWYRNSNCQINFSNWQSTLWRIKSSVWRKFSFSSQLH